MNAATWKQVQRLAKKLRDMDQNPATTMQEFDALWDKAVAVAMTDKADNFENRQAAFYTVHRLVTQSLAG